MRIILTLHYNFHTHYLSYTSFCPTHNFSQTSYVLHIFCPTMHIIFPLHNMFYTIFVLHMIVHTLHMFYTWIMTHIILYIILLYTICLIHHFQNTSCVLQVLCQIHHFTYLSFVLQIIFPAQHLSWKKNSLDRFLLNPIPAGGDGGVNLTPLVVFLHNSKSIGLRIHTQSPPYILKALPLGLKPGFNTNCLSPQAHCLNDWSCL